jgi:hypothetical protein
MATSTRELLAALARLTGDSGTPRRHNVVFRILVTSSDGVVVSVNLDANPHRTEASRANLNDLADRMRIERADIGKVLEGWSEATLRQHLAGFTGDELKPPAYRQRT